MIKSSKSSTIMNVGRKAEHDFKGLIVPLLKKWDKESDDPEHMISLSQMEMDCNITTEQIRNIVTEMMSDTISAMDTKELIKSKKACSSRKG